MADGPTLIPLDNVDPALVEELLDRAFEPGRHKRTAYKVREGMDWLPGLSFAAIDSAEHLVGTIQCWPVALTDPDGRRHPMIMVGPVAVEPGAQGTGQEISCLYRSSQLGRGKPRPLLFGPSNHGAQRTYPAHAPLFPLRLYRLVRCSRRTSTRAGSRNDRTGRRS